MMMRLLDGVSTLALRRKRGLFVFIGLLGFMSMAGNLFSQDIPDESMSEEIAPLEPSSEEGVEKTPEEEKEGGGKSFEVMPHLDEAPRFQYKSREGRDPFLSFVNPGEKDLSGLPPLQRVSVSELKLIGVAWSSGRINAMLQTPDGKTYPVTQGTRVGNSRGRVGHIGSESLTVQEPYLNIFGRTALRQVVMKLYKKKEGQE